MKRTKIIIVAVLLFALLISSCGQLSPKPAETKAVSAEAAPEEAPLKAEPAPLADSALMPLAASGSTSTVTKAAGSLFSGKFEGTAVEGSAEAVDGVYRMAVTKTDGEAWHIKLESNYPTMPGNDYRITYHFRSDVAGKVKFGDFQEFDVRPGDNVVSSMLVASAGTSYLDLQLGLLPAPFTVEFTGIEVEEFADEVEYENALSSPVNFEDEKAVYEKHDQGYGILFDRHSDRVTLEYVATSWENGVWKSRLYVRTGLVPEPATRYHVSVDMAVDQDTDFEVLFNKEDEEKGYGAMYGLHLNAGEPATIESVVTGGAGDDDGELVVQFSLGNVPEGAKVDLSNFKVEKITDHYSNMLPYSFSLDKEIYTGKTLYAMVPTDYTNIPLAVSYNGVDTVWEHHDSGDYEASLEESADSATLRISKAPESDRNVWRAQLFAQTDVVLEGGKSYVIKLDVEGSRDQSEYEVCFDGDYEDAYGFFKGESARSLKAGETDHVEHFVSPDVAHGALRLRLQLGKTDTTAGNDVTLRNFSIEEVKPTATDIGSQSYDTGSAEELADVEMPGFAYPVTTEATVIHVDDAYVAQPLSLSAAEIAWDGSEASASVDGGEASLVISKEKDDGGIWSTRLQVGTGVVLEPGASYQLSAALSAEQPTGAWELLLSNSQDEDDGYNKFGSGYGFGMSGEDGADIFVNFTAPTDLSSYHELVLRFQLGNSGVNTVTVSNIALSKLVPAHDETSGGSTEGNSFFIEENIPEVKAELSGDGSSATAHITAPGDDWHIKLYALTGVTLESGKTYRISADVADAAGCGIAYKREGGDEEDFGYEAISGSGTVVHEVTPDTDGKLELVFKIGNAAEGSNVNVSNIRIQELVSSGGGAAPINFWAHEDYSASASNTASSATLKVESAPDGGREVWKVKLFAETGVTLEPGKNYRVLADVAASRDLDYELCYNRNEVEKGFDALYGLHAGSEAQTVSRDFTAQEAGQLILQFSIGNAVSDTEVTISGIQVQELSVSGGEDLLSGFRYNSVGSVSSAADAGYIASIEKNSDSATFRIHQAPEERNPWNVKLFVKTGFVPEGGKGYRVSFDIDAARDQGLMEVFYDGNTENAYGSLFNQTLPAGEKTVSYVINPDASKGELVLQIRLGKTDGTDGNSYTVSNVKVEEVTYTTSSAPEKKEACVLRTEPGYSSKLEKSADRATVKIEKTPAEGMEPWKTKLFVETGVTLKAGQKYRISLNVKSVIPSPFEICFNNGGEEKGLGAIFGLMATPAGQPVEYVTYARQDTDLVIQLSLGNCPAPNSIVLSGVSVEKAGAIDPISDTLYTF